jgi:DNA-binding transcriptional MerR regulator
VGARLASPSGDGRISPVPDARTVRYYATLGLIDRPLVQGREARYRERHVLQLLAIKVLQAHGLRLGEIQRRLYARSDAELTALVEAGAPRTGRAQPPIVWREVALAPGLKLVADEHWAPGPQSEVLVQKFREALAALAPPTETP